MSSMIGSLTPQRKQALALSLLFMLSSAGIKASTNWLLKISRLNHHLTLLARCLRLSAAVTNTIPRLATGGWLTLARLASHQLDYSPFVWAHNSDFARSRQSSRLRAHALSPSQIRTCGFSASGSS